MMAGYIEGSWDIVVKNIMWKEWVVFDYTLSSMEWFNNRYKLAKDAGKSVEIDVVYADPKFAWKLNDIRNTQWTQKVSQSILDSNHTKFRETVSKIQKEYPDVKVNVYVNRGMDIKPKKIHERDVANFIG